MWKCKKCGSKVTQDVVGTFFGYAEIDKEGNCIEDSIKVDCYDDVYTEKLNCDCGECCESFYVEEVAIWEED